MRLLCHFNWFYIPYSLLVYMNFINTQIASSMVSIFYHI